MKWIEKTKIINKCDYWEDIIEQSFNYVKINDLMNNSIITKS